MVSPALTLPSAGDYDRRGLSTSASVRHITLPAIRDAAAAVYAAAIRTPLVHVELPGAGRREAPDLYLKLEALQPIGSVKVRGAYNVVRQLSAAQLRQGG